MVEPDPPRIEDYRISFGVLNGTIFVRNVFDPRMLWAFQDAERARRAIDRHHSDALLSFDAMASGRTGIMF